VSAKITTGSRFDSFLCFVLIDMTIFRLLLNAFAYSRGHDYPRPKISTLSDLMPLLTTLTILSDCWFLKLLPSVFYAVLELCWMTEAVRFSGERIRNGCAGINNAVVSNRTLFPILKTGALISRFRLQHCTQILNHYLLSKSWFVLKTKVSKLALSSGVNVP
jgi:hypothetical protein